MSGKRVRQSNSRWLRSLASVLFATAAVALMVPLTGSADAEPVFAGAEPAPVTEPWGLRPPSVVSHDGELPDIHRLGALVQETAPAEDTYFDDAVFLGDSRTEGFKLYSGLDRGRYLYATGATVDTVVNKASWDEGGRKLSLVEALGSMDNVGKVYVMLGVNELGWSRTANFHDRYARVVEEIRQSHPEARIILQSILPVSAEQEARHTYVNNGRIREYNQVVRQVAEELDCWFVNVAEAVSGPDGCLPEDSTFDGVHLNRAGCRQWLDYLRTHTV